VHISRHPLVLLAVLGLLIIGLVLIHRGRGGGITDMFGGGLASGIQSSAVGERNLTRITWGVAIAWGLIIVLLGLIGGSRSSGPEGKLRKHGRRQCNQGFARRRGPLGEEERGESAPRQVSRTTARAVTSPAQVFAIADDAEVPVEWDCPKCGLPAGSTQTTHRSHCATSHTRRTLPT